MAAILAGLIPSSAEATKPSVTNNQVSHERLLSEQQFNLFETNDKQVILAKSDGNPISLSIKPGPSNFPTPLSAGRPARPISVTRYPSAPKLVDQGLGAAGNPANPAGGGDDGGGNGQCPVSKEQKSEELKVFDSHSDSRSKISKSKSKKQPSEQCEADENLQNEEIKIKIVSRIKEDTDTGLTRAARDACKNATVQRNVNELQDKLAKGHKNPGIGRKNLFKGVVEHRAEGGGRLYVRELKDGVIEILAKSGKSKDNQDFVIKRLEKIYG